MVMLLVCTTATAILMSEILVAPKSQVHVFAVAAEDAVRAAEHRYKLEILDGLLP